MTVIVGAGRALNIYDLLNLTALGNSVATGSSSSSSFTTQGAGARYQVKGTGFGDFEGGIPTKGTITGVTYTQGGATVVKWTGLSMSMTQIFQFLVNNNPAGLSAYALRANDQITGSNKNDILAGFNGNDTIKGGLGRDELNGGLGKDKLNGGAGNDKVIGGAGDTMDGGAGVDTVRYDTTRQLNISTAQLLSATGTRFSDGALIKNVERFELITGNQADVLTINSRVSGANLFSAGGGNDRVEATLTDVGAVTLHHFTSQPSTLQFNGGNLQISNVESFWITAGAAADDLEGGVGNDRLNGAGGNDYLSDSNGYDDPTADADVLDGGDGDDMIWGNNGTDTLQGGAGDDHIYAQGGGADAIDGGTGFDMLTLVRTGTTIAYNITVSGIMSQAGITFGDGTVLRNIEAFEIYAGSGNDVLTVDRALTGPNLFDGGLGVDRVIADLSAVSSQVVLDYGAIYVDNQVWIGVHNVEELRVTAGSANDILKDSSGADVLNGGDGVDNLYTTSGADTLNGGAGDDRLHVTRGTGADIIDGGAGDDTAFITRVGSNVGTSFSLAGVATNGGATFSTGDVLRNIEKLRLTCGAGDDVLTVTEFSGDHMINAAEGNDTFILDVRDTPLMYGFGAYPGSITLGSGTLTFSGFEKFIIYGGDGSETATLDDGADEFYGGDGNDRVEGEGGHDLLFGEGGNDFLEGGSSSLIDGGAGIDEAYVFLSTSAATVLSTAALNSVSGFTFADGTVIRNVEIFTLWLGGGADVVTFNSALAGGVSAIDGGQGDDLFIADFSAQGQVVMEANRIYIGTTRIDVSMDRHHITTGAGNDTLSGAAGADILSAGNGDDRLYGNEANDTLTGGDGNDIIEGGDGIDTVNGGAGNDTLNGGNGVDIVSGGAGDDMLRYQGDVFDGGDGVDTLDCLFFGALTINLVDGTGTFGAQITNVENVIATFNADTLIGSDVANRLDGSSGNDTISGGGGDDVLIGGAGTNTLTGGAGADTFVLMDTYSNGFGVETITDFEVGVDTISVSENFDITLDPDVFHLGTAATSASQRLIYDEVSGTLYYDVDGSGAIAQRILANLTDGLALRIDDLI
jgi:Ca2+-binding RTX toxin-like protein